MVSLVVSQEMPGIETRDGSVVFIAPNEAAFVRDETYQTSKSELSGLDASLKSTVGKLSGRVDAIVEQATGIKSDIESSNVAIKNVGDVSTALKQSRSKIRKITENAHADVHAAASEHDILVNQTVNDIEDSLEAAFGALKAELAKQKAALDTSVKGKLEGMADTNVALTATTALLNAEIDAHEDCTANGLLYDVKKEKCVESKVDARKMIPKVWHRDFHNDDGREHGYINERYVQFTKHNDDTYMRIVYYDNLRVHGHLAHGQWNVMICDGNGNGCDHCGVPGRLNLWRWSRHQGNWWMNDHVGHTLTGICKKSNNRDLRKGNYRVRTRLDNPRYDMYTGHNTEQCNFMVDEVLKY